MEQRRRPLWLIIPLFFLLLVLFGGAYTAILAATIDVSRLTDSRTASDRDLIYLGIHAGTFALAIIAGYVFGRWANGQAFAFAALLFILISIWMLAAQVGSYAIACEINDGRNDVIRHWQC